MKPFRYWPALLIGAALLSIALWVDTANAKPSHAKGKGKPTEAIAAPQVSPMPEGISHNKPIEESTPHSHRPGTFALPPGIQKNLSRGKKMPPGIAKKMQVNPIQVP